MNKLIYIIFGFFFFGSLYLVLKNTLYTDSKSDVYPYKFKLYYPEVNGILEKDKVLVQGVEFGIIQKIEIIDTKKPSIKNQFPNQNQIVEITIALKKPLNIWKNYKISFQNSKTTLSRRLINIELGNNQVSEFLYQKGLQKEFVEFPLKSNFYEHFFHSFTNMLEENRTDVKSITKNIKQITQKLKSSQNGTLPRLLNSEEMYDHLLETSQKAQITAREARWYKESTYHLEDSYPFGITALLIKNFVFNGRGIFTPERQ